MNKLLSIGEFSRITGLTVKTLRFYHERGLLTPARVDAGSGYRYYDAANLETARGVVALRKLEFSVAEIQSILAEHGGSDALSLLQRRREAVATKIATQQSLLEQLDQLIEVERTHQAMANETSFEVERRELPAMMVAGMRVKGRYAEIGSVFGKLGRTCGRHIAGPAFCLYYDCEYREEDADFEPCFPLKRSIEKPGVSVRELPGGMAVCLKHCGPYETLKESYAKLVTYMNEQGLSYAKPSREVYLKGPGRLFKGDPAKYLTEIQFLIEA